MNDVGDHTILPTDESESARELWWLSKAVLGFLLIVFALACWDQLGNRILNVWAESSANAEGWQAGLLLEGTVWLLAPFVLAFGLFLFRHPWRSRLDAWTESLGGHADHVDRLPERHLWWLIALAAGAGLFAELSIIRLHGAFIQLFAYFKNVSLLSCFLGLGIGYARSSRSLLLTPLVLPLLACQLLGLDLLRTTSATDYLENPIPEQISLGLTRLAPAVASSLAGMALLAIVFAFNALCFIPFGQLAGRLMARTERLRAYSWNLLGSIVGVGLFNLLAMAWTPPTVWMFFVAVSVLPFLGRRHLLPTAVASLLLITGIGWLGLSTTEKDVYSPYQKLTVQQLRDAPPVIEVANVYYQRMLDLQADGAEFDDAPGLQRSKEYYELPYRIRPQPQRVLVVGAGTGNDVAAAVRHGASEIHAVEIDPVILEIGQKLHPEAPYSSPAVMPVVDDARAYLRRSRQSYDLIVYGLLDSHTLLSGVSSVRLDSFVYTVEGFREARDRLAPGGVLAITFTLIDDRLGFKIFGMLKEAFEGREPLVFATQHDLGRMFVIGDALDEDLVELDVAAQIDQDFSRLSAASDVDLSTDDWPFFYMPERRYPVSYVVMVVALVAVSFFLVRRFLHGGETRTSWPCFFLGAGFMLVETKGITELALVYGSTWIVVGLVIVAILVLAYFANLLVATRGLPPRILSYGLLMLSVVAGLVLVSLDLGALGFGTQRWVLTLGLTLPLFFSGLAFSSELVRAPSLQAALSANLLGAMLGGFLEYNAMYFGYRALYLVALAVYAAAWFASTRGSSR